MLGGEEVNRFIESGILELYVLGGTTPEETAEVGRMASLYPEIADEIETANAALEAYTQEHAIEPPITVKAFVWATINYMDRMKKGEKASFPAILNPNSKIADYSEWLDREDLQLTEPLEDLNALIIGYTPQVTTAIVWIKDCAPPEHHSNEQEKFLIVEGSCDLVVGKDVYQMNPGDVFDMPLHVSHRVQVTSSIPCKVILQRVALAA